jgi:soluble lytic murein transglycosylase-like protein
MATVDDDYYQSLLDAGNASLDEYNKNQDQLANAAPPPAAPESLADKMVQAFKNFVGAGSSGAGVGEFKESEAGRNWQVSGLPDADPFYGHDQPNLPYQDPNITDNSQQSVQNIKDTLGQYVDAAVTDLQRVREANQNAAANSTNPDLTALPDADPFYAHDQSGQPYMDPNIRTPEQEQAANQAYRDIVGTAAGNLAITPGVPAPVRGVAGLLYAPALAQDMVNTYNQNAEQQSQSSQDHPYAALAQTAEQTLVDPVLGPIKQALTHPIDYVQNIMDNPTRLWSEAFLPGTVIGKPMQKIQAWADRNLTADDMVDAYNQDHSSSGDSQPDMQLAQAAQAQPGTVDAWIQEASQTYGVPENLIRSVIDAESSFNPEAGSSAGAYGYMQLMPETAESLGVDRTDPRQNILGGTKYLREQLDSFGGNVENALAAYNAGPEAVREAGGVPDYPETQAYVAKIMNNLGNEKINLGPGNEALHSPADVSSAIPDDPLSSDKPSDSNSPDDSLAQSVDESDTAEPLADTANNLSDNEAEAVPTADDATKEAYLQASHKAAMDGDYQTAYDLAIKAGRPDWAREWRRLSDYGDLDYSKTSSSNADLPDAQDIVEQFNQDQPNPSSKRVLRTPGVDPNAAPNPADIQPKMGINAVADKFLQSLSPESRDDMARFTAESIRNHRAELDHARDTAFADLKPLSQDFARQANQALGVLRDMTQGQIDQMVEDIQQGRTAKDPKLKPVYDTLDFINRLETGQKQLSRSKQALADAVRYELDSRVQTIQGFGNGKLQQAIQNYFPHIWDKGDNLWRQLNSKRPLLGTQSFTKKRSIDSTLQGIKLGFLPKTLDPAEMTLMKAREMDHYIAGQRSMNDLAQKGWRQYHSVFDHDIPQGWVKVNDRAGTVYGPPHVVVKEAYDAQMMDTLNQVAADLGVTHERSTTLGRGMAAGTWGVSEPFGRKIMTRFGGPESVLAHEIGHQMDAKYDMQEIFLHPNDPALEKTIRGELKNLAALRDDHPEAPDKKFSAYLQKPSEQMATIVQAYVHAPELLKKTAPNTYSLLQEFLSAHEELHPLQNIQRSLQLGENETTQGIGGMMVRGHYYVPESAGRVLDNYLNPGLRGNAIYDTLATASNTLNAAQLALSAYHAGFTTLEATASKASLGVEKLLQGNIAGGVKDLGIAATPGLAAGLNIRRGAKLYAAWFDPQKYPEMQPIVKAMEMAGGRPTMDPVYSLRQAKSIREAFQANGLVGVAQNAYRIPGAIMEGLSYPIMEWLVPRQKLGVFADMAANELKRNPDMTPEQMRHVMARVWDSVDNRLGQIVYDNKFISRTTKDAAFLGMRSVGWNYGTWAELGGAPVDLLAAKSRMGRGENLVSHKMAYAIAMPVTVALYGAIAQYVMTGQGPQEWKDYFYPRTGQLDANGRPQRVSLPSYIKDLYHLWNAPGQTVLDKLNPLWSIAADLYNNRDFYGTRIENQDDPWYMRRAQDVEYLAKSIVPFGIRNAMQNKMLGGSLANQALPFVGITSAPGGINLTAAEQKMEEYLSQDIPAGTRTQEQNDARDLKRSILRDVQQGNYESLGNALAAGRISPKQAREYTTEGKMSPLVRGFAYLRPDQAIQVYNAGSAEEKQLLRKPLGTKLKNFNAQASPEEKAQMQALIKTIHY